MRDYEHTSRPRDLKGFKGFLVGWKGPNEAQAAWEFSEPVTADEAAGVIMTIGRDDTKFGVCAYADKGSASNIDAPTVTFGEGQPLKQFVPPDPVEPYFD